MKSLIPFVAAFTALSSTAYAQSSNKGEAFVCVEQDSAGFNVDTQNNYRRVGFKPARFTMVLTGQQLSVKVGNKTEYFQCTNPWSSNKRLLQCTEKFFFMGLDLNDLTFTRSQIFGPLGDAQDKDSLSVSYGDCQRF